MASKRTARKPSRPRKTVSINISAFEIIQRGATIVIKSSAPIDERAIASGLRFDKTRAKPAISDRGRHVVIAVDDSFASGRNTLYLSDLYTPKSLRIEADLEVPFFVVDSKVTFPRDMKVESYSRVAVVGDRIRPVSPGESPTYELMKGTHRADGKPWEAAYDKAGKEVDFNEVRAGVMKARVKRYGKLEPRLHKRLAGGETGPLSVALWLREDYHVKEKSDRREAKKMSRAEAAGRKRFLDQAYRFTEKYRLAEFARNVRVDQAAPVIFAELDSEAIRRLADIPEVSIIFLYDREGIEDLTDSMAIAQSGDAHDLGYTGSGVRVAVYERGPDDTTNLSITARFRTNPSTSQHSRHTHGIIKNRERNRPHGHAPDCLLHSANDFDLDAIRWAAQDQGCTVISQSFHRSAEQTDSDLSFDDVYKDWLALHWPYPTICEAAGNGADTEFVNHKGYNRLTVANTTTRPTVWRATRCSATRTPITEIASFPKLPPTAWASRRSA